MRLPCRKTLDVWLRFSLDLGLRRLLEEEFRLQMLLYRQLGSLGLQEGLEERFRRLLGGGLLLWGHHLVVLLQVTFILHLIC
jgi:hypothetical protein